MSLHIGNDLEESLLGSGDLGFDELCHVSGLTVRLVGGDGVVLAEVGLTVDVVKGAEGGHEVGNLRRRIYGCV